MSRNHPYRRASPLDYPTGRDGNNSTYNYRATSDTRLRTYSNKRVFSTNLQTRDYLTTVRLCTKRRHFEAVKLKSEVPDFQTPHPSGYNLTCLR